MDRTLSSERYLLVGIVASLFAGTAIAVIHNAGLDIDVTRVLVLVPIIIISFIACREHININKRTSLMMVLGLLSGAIYYASFYTNSPVMVHASNGLTSYFMFF